MRKSEMPKMVVAAAALGIGILPLLAASPAHADDPAPTPAPISGSQVAPPPAEAPAWTGDYDDGDIWIVL
jgi:hypothetical protein